MPQLRIGRSARPTYHDAHFSFKSPDNPDTSGKNSLGLSKRFLGESCCHEINLYRSKYIIYSCWVNLLRFSCKHIPARNRAACAELYLARTAYALSYLHSLPFTSFFLVLPRMILSWGCIQIFSIIYATGSSWAQKYHKMARLKYKTLSQCTH
jgi:hypothetical protein